MKTENKDPEFNFLQEQFFTMLFKDFGPLKITEKLENWYRISWEKFKEELYKQNINLVSDKHRDWEEYFHFHKNKMIEML